MGLENHTWAYMELSKSLIADIKMRMLSIGWGFHGKWRWAKPVDG